MSQDSLDLHQADQMYLVWMTTERWWLEVPPEIKNDPYYMGGPSRMNQCHSSVKTLYAIVKSRHDVDRMIPNLKKITVAPPYKTTTSRWGALTGDATSFDLELVNFTDVDAYEKMTDKQLTLNPISGTIRTTK